METSNGGRDELMEDGWREGEKGGRDVVMTTVIPWSNFSSFLSSHFLRIRENKKTDGQRGGGGGEKQRKCFMQPSKLQDKPLSKPCLALLCSVPNLYFQ